MCDAISDNSVVIMGTLHRSGSPEVLLVCPLEASQGALRAPHRGGADKVGPEIEQMTYLNHRGTTKP